MFFYRRGELTDEKERTHLEVQEAGDEFQKGLALGALSILFGVIGIILLIVFAAYNSAGYHPHSNSLRISGIFLLGLGVVVGLPALGFILLFYKDQKKRPTCSTERDAEGDVLPTLSGRLMGKLSESKTRRLAKSATKLQQKLQALSMEHERQEFVPGTSSQYPTDEINKFKSFSEFGRTQTVSNFNLYRERLLAEYVKLFDCDCDQITHHKSDTAIDDQNLSRPMEWVTVEPHDLEPTELPAGLQTPSKLILPPNSVRNSIRSGSLSPYTATDNRSVNSQRPSIAQPNITAQSSVLSSDRGSFITAADSLMAQSALQSTAQYATCADDVLQEGLDSKNLNDNNVGEDNFLYQSSDLDTFRTAEEPT